MIKWLKEAFKKVAKRFNCIYFITSSQNYQSNILIKKISFGKKKTKKSQFFQKNTKLQVKF